MIRASLRVELQHRIQRPICDAPEYLKRHGPEFVVFYGIAPEFFHHGPEPSGNRLYYKKIHAVNDG